MKKTVLILFFSFFANILFSQQIQYEYAFKREKTKSRFLSGVKQNYSELDSLVLYKDGTFYRKRFYRYHEIILTQYVGVWQMKNGYLNLTTTKFNPYFEKEKWFDYEKNFRFLIKNKKLIPISGYDKHDNRKLKLN